MKQKEICRIIGMTRLSSREKFKNSLKYIHRVRGEICESFTATDGRCISMLCRPLPGDAKKESQYFESALLDGRGHMAKRQDLRFPDVREVYPDSGEEAVFFISVSWLLDRLKKAKRKEDFLFLETGGLFYADAHNEAIFLNPLLVRTMAMQMKYLKGYGFGDNVTMSIWPKKNERNTPVLFNALCVEYGMSYDFLLMPVSIHHASGYLGANVKIN